MLGVYDRPKMQSNPSFETLFFEALKCVLLVGYVRDFLVLPKAQHLANMSTIYHTYLNSDGR